MAPSSAWVRHPFIILYQLFLLFSSEAPSVATAVIPSAGIQHDWAHLRLPEGRKTVEASYWLSAQGSHGLEVDPQLNKRWHDKNKLFLEILCYRSHFHFVLLYYISTILYLL